MPDDDEDFFAEVEVPADRLSATALREVIEEFVTREATEYGAEDVPLATKVAQVRTQIERGELKILFDARSETVNIVRAIDLPRRDR